MITVTIMEKNTNPTGKKKITAYSIGLWNINDMNLSISKQMSTNDNMVYLFGEHVKFFIFYN